MDKKIKELNTKLYDVGPVKQASDLSGLAPVLLLPLTEPGLYVCHLRLEYAPSLLEQPLLPYAY